MCYLQVLYKKEIYKEDQPNLFQYSKQGMTSKVLDNLQRILENEMTNRQQKNTGKVLYYRNTHCSVPLASVKKYYERPGQEENDNPSFCKFIYEMY